MDTIVTLLPFVLPPLLGAVIGYVTNALAIKMLFRPLEEKRFLGVRIPLTPGIIPRQRDRLAHSIARMVSTKLLTEDILLSRLQDDEFSRSLEETVSRFTADVLDGVTGSESPDAHAQSEVIRVFEKIVQSFFASNSFATIVRKTTDSLAGGAMQMRADRLLPSADVVAALVNRGLDAATDGPFFENAERAARDWLTGHLERDTPLGDIIGGVAVERIQGVVPGLYEPALDALIAFLRQQSTRDALSVHGRELVGRILKRLNLFQRFLVSATQYDKNLRETMPEIVDDVIASVDRAGRDMENRGRLIVALQAKVKEIAATGVRSLFERFELDANELVSRLFALAGKLIRRDDVREKLADAVNGFTIRHGGEDIGTLIEKVAGTPQEQVVERVVAIAERWVGDHTNRMRLASRVVTFVRERLAGPERVPLSELLPIASDDKESIDHFLTVRLQTLVARRVPEIISGLDVYTMVVNKINGLDMESVEQLLLMVIARHLKWINLFGALLGSIIGGIQVVLSQVV